LRIDVHQHIWSPRLIDALRARDTRPRLDGWTLHLDGEPPFEVDPADHDQGRRAALLRADGADLGLVSLSSPLGIEHLPPGEAAPLLDAYHEGAAELPGCFRSWASASLAAPDPDGLARMIGRGFVGLQLPATTLADAAGYALVRPLLEVLEATGRPLFVHPGPAGETAQAPPWWPALVPYVGQMHAAWYAFTVFGRPAHPRLRVCFALLAGLAPLHAERFAVRAGAGATPDADMFVETSSYGPFAVGAALEVLGTGAVVHGTDRPYAPPRPEHPDRDVERAIKVTNPLRLLGGEV
jgi:predicted TIM-barrel fold metal-dependent hydrolase